MKVAKTLHKLLFYGAVLSLVALALLIVFGENGLLDLKGQVGERERLLAKNQDLQGQILALSRKVSRLKSDPLYIEHSVRQELGLIGENELVFKQGGVAEAERKATAAPTP
jgi:cell division protein FtsB